MKIEVKDAGKQDEGGWVHCDDKPLGATNLYILILWDEPMDEGGKAVYAGNHLKATGEFPSASELPVCEGSIYLNSGSLPHDTARDEKVIMYHFSDHAGLLKAYAEAKKVFDFTTTWRGWLRTANAVNARPGLATLRAQLKAGTIAEKNLLWLALNDGWTVGQHRQARRNLGLQGLY